MFGTIKLLSVGVEQKDMLQVAPFTNEKVRVTDSHPSKWVFSTLFSSFAYISENITITKPPSATQNDSDGKDKPEPGRLGKQQA